MKFCFAAVSAFSLIVSEVFASPVTYNTNSTVELTSLDSTDVIGWNAPTFPEYHQSCNETNIRMLNAAFKDSLEVTAYAKSRLLNYGVDDTYYKRWFGNGSIYTVIGLLDHLMESSKEGILYRCDDADGKCAANPTSWAGHYRVSNPMQTVICNRFYSVKKPLTTMCFDGTILEVGPTHYAGIDMLHRYLHAPTMNSDEYITEYVEEVNELLEFAKNNATHAVRNVENYLYYVADVYSSAVVPGGCLGDL